MPKNHKRNSKISISYLESNYDESIQENEYRINKLSGWLTILHLLVIFYLILVSTVGVLDIDDSKIFFIIIFFTVLSIIPYLISTVLKTHKPWVKYFFMCNDCVLAMFAYGFISENVRFLLMLPILKACLYCNYKQTKITFVCSSVSLLFAHLLNAIISGQTFRLSVLTIFFSQYIQYLIICIAALFVSKNSTTLIHRTYQASEKSKELAQEMRKSRYEIVKSLCIIADRKSQDTGQHIERVYEYMKILAEGCGYTGDRLSDIALSAMLHDIGKLGIDNSILSKPCKLTDAEYEEMKKHVSIGHDMLVNSPDSVMKMASVLAYQHHERWDGKGYLGLHENKIEQLSQLMSIVDVFDALTSKRCYKEPWSISSSYEEILNGKGTQFSPAAVDVFIANFEKIRNACHRMNPDCFD